MKEKRWGVLHVLFKIHRGFDPIMKQPFNEHNMCKNYILP